MVGLAFNKEITAREHSKLFDSSKITDDHFSGSLPSWTAFKMIELFNLVDYSLHIIFIISDTEEAKQNFPLYPNVYNIVVKYKIRDITNLLQ